MKRTTQLVWDRSLQPILRRMGVDVQRYPPRPEATWTERAFEGILASRRSVADPALPATLNFLQFCALHACESKAQCLQDLFVRWQLRDKANGFFVDFGATDGVTLSNSWGLETQRGWRGILAEPARGWQQALRENRRGIVDARCVWSCSGQILRFNEAPVAEFSTVDSLSEKDA